MDSNETINQLVSTKPAGVFDQIRANSRLPLILVSSAAIAAIAAVFMWAKTPDYGVLYSNLSDKDGGAIIASLQQMNIPYKFSQGGSTLLVVANKVPEARLKLASLGLPKGGTVGFELMDNQKFGTSQFAEQVNYQRSLEGEIARSINLLSPVESSRVHLALPKTSLFVRDQKKPSASVVITLHKGRSLDEGQASAIVHLISSSVPDLSPKNINVVDQNGNLLSTASSGGRGLDVSQIKYTQEIEQEYVKRIDAILLPILGKDNSHSQVVAELDFTVVENTEEKYKPNQDTGSAAMRSQTSSDSGQQGSSGPGGVPGALTNQPAATPTAPITAGQPDASQTKKASSDNTGRTGSSSNRKDFTINYELDKSIRHVQQAAGGIKRLSAAVVVNYKTTLNAQGKPESTALTPQEIEQINNLVQQAMGFSKDRGDSLNVVNKVFVSEAVEISDQTWWKLPENISMMKEGAKYLGIAIFALYLWFAVVRPFMRKYLQDEAKNVAKIGRSTTTGQETFGIEQALRETEDRRVERSVENGKYAIELANKDPKMVAMLLNDWMKK
jgi:flagellar M-ring protein FliF